MAAFFLVTDMSIGGMVALPAAIIHARWLIIFVEKY
jgi:hypothetical protein